MPNKVFPNQIVSNQSQAQEVITSIIEKLPPGTHLTVPQVFRQVQAQGLSVSLSTVYRILNNLKVLGNVNTVGGDRSLRYEAHVQGHDHDHLICLKCGLTIEFVDDLIRGFGQSVAQRKGFEHKSSRFDIFGFCNECRTKDEDYKLEHSIACLTDSIFKLEDVISVCRTAITYYELRKTHKANELIKQAVSNLQIALANCNETINMFNKEEKIEQ